jgi:hypothetical protein
MGKMQSVIIKAGGTYRDHRALSVNRTALCMPRTRRKAVPHKLPYHISVTGIKLRQTIQRFNSVTPAQVEFQVLTAANMKMTAL